MAATIISILALIVSASSLAIAYFAWRSKEKERQPRLWARFEPFDKAGWWRVIISFENPALVGFAPIELHLLSGGEISQDRGTYVGSGGLKLTWQLSDRIEQAQKARSVEVSRQGRVGPNDTMAIKVVVFANTTPLRFRLDCHTVEGEPKARKFSIVGHLPSEARVTG